MAKGTWPVPLAIYSFQPNQHFRGKHWLISWNGSLPADNKPHAAHEELKQWPGQFWRRANVLLELVCVIDSAYDQFWFKAPQLKRNYIDTRQYNNTSDKLLLLIKWLGFCYWYANEFDIKISLRSNPNERFTNCDSKFSMEVFCLCLTYWNLTSEQTSNSTLRTNSIRGRSVSCSIPSSCMAYSKIPSYNW